MAIDADFVSFVWAAGGSSSSDHGGGATKAAWDAGTPSDFITLANGLPTSHATTWDGGDTACVAEAGAGDTVKISAEAGDFQDCVTGTIANIKFDTNGGLDGYYTVTRIDDDYMTIDGLTYSGDLGGSDDNCDVHVGGAMSSIADVASTDLADASSYNCDVLIKGNETLTGDVTVAGGGGTASTMLRFLGVDSDWARIVPTRAAIGGGKANGLLDTSGMPKITLDTNVEFIINEHYVQVDGIWFFGNTVAPMVGSGGVGDYQVYSNCVFTNAGTNATSRCVRADNNCKAYNCDFLATGGSGTTIAVEFDTGCEFVNCRVTNASNDAGSFGIDMHHGVVIGCVFYDILGTGLRYAAPSGPHLVAYCTFDDVVKAISTPNVAETQIFMLVNNIAKDCTDFADNLHAGTANHLLVAFHNVMNGNTDNYSGYAGDIDTSGDSGKGLGFQDLTSDPLFVSEANDDYNLQATSPAKNTGPFLNNRGAMSDVEAGGGIIRHPGMTGGIDG